MTPTTTNESLRLTMDTNQAVSRLFSAISLHNRAIAFASANAIASEDVAVIGKFRDVLLQMTDILEKFEQPLPAAAPPVES